MCTLRASGKYFDVDSFVKKSKLKPCLVYHTREAKNPKPIKKIYKWPDSGVNVPVSNASFQNYRRQIRDAIKFLIKNKTEIRKLINFKGVESVELDFPTSHDRNNFIQDYFLPAELIALACQLGLELRISEYPESDEKPT
jgi:hypothetical protein